MNQSIKVLITGASPDFLNRNVPLRNHVTEGFSEILGSDQVVQLPLEVAPDRIRTWIPQLVLVFGSALPDSADYTGIRCAAACVGAPLAFWVHDDPYEFDAGAKIRRMADHIFSNDRWASRHYHRDNVWHLPMAASPTAHSPAGEMGEYSEERDLFFCGVAFEKRKRMVKDLSQIIIKVKTEIYGEGWDISDLPFCRNERIPQEQLVMFYVSSRIVLNLGRDFNYANRQYDLVPSTPGPRTFEAAMAGACQMIFADSLEIMDYFEIDKEIVLFDDPTDFEAKLFDLLDHPEKRVAIGQAARVRCLKDHTYAARAALIMKLTGLLQ